MISEGARAQTTVRVHGMPAGATRSLTASTTRTHSGYQPGSVSQRSSTNPAVPRWEGLDELVLAYATTIQQSQGSECPAVVIPLTTQHYPVLQRNLDYTGVPRGKRLLVLMGSGRHWRPAVKGARARRRWSKLGEWLIGSARPNASG